VLVIKKLITVLIVITTQFIKRNIIQWSHIIPPISYPPYKSCHHITVLSDLSLF